jgi:hypothetical protein
MKRWLALSLATLAGAAAAGPFDQPWSIVETDAFPATDYLYRPVIVNRIDDQNSIDNRVITTPGKHMVTLDVPARKGFSLATQQTFEFELAPCTRYYFGAQLESTTGQRWKPVVRRQESIGECRRQFNLSAAS